MKEKTLIKHYKGLFNEYAKNSQFFKLYNKLKVFFDSLKIEGKNIILAVSGGADSMLVASQILYYFYINELNFKNIHIAHCNHKIRIESNNEAKFMSEFFSGLDFHLFEREDLKNNDENSLRNRRYSQFSKLQIGTKSVFVFLGHHLNDRIESTFLNLMRGAGINGFLNMQEVENHHLLPDDCKVCRPLLNISKDEILSVCNDVGIPYFEDRTNFEDSVSKRNRVRNKIINPLSVDSKFLNSFSEIYKQIEKITDKDQNENLKLIPSFPLWKVDFSYLWENDILNCDEEDVFKLFKILKIQISTNIIKEWKSWLNVGNNGYKYIKGVYFFIHEKHLFIIKAKKDFWKRKNGSEESVVVGIKKMNDINFFGFSLNVPRDELIGGEIRLPKNGDLFAGKKWNRWAMNQKIPMRWRDWIPLAIKNGKVIHMWKNVWK